MLKTKLLPHSGAFANPKEAQLEVAYFNIYFNPDCRHSALGYRSPQQFKAAFLQRLPELAVRSNKTTPNLCQLHAEPFWDCSRP